METLKERKIKSKQVIVTTFILFGCLFITADLGAATGRALLIGIDDYHISQLVSLQGPKNDLPLVKKMLLEKFSFKENNITVLQNRAATHTGLEKAFAQLARQTAPGDFVYIHYSGHGSQVIDQNGDEYPQNFDQTWVPYGSRSTIMEGKDRLDIIDDELYLWLLPIFEKTPHVVFVSDSCHSAGVTRGDVLGVRTVPAYGGKLPPITTNPGRDKAFNRGICIGAVQESGIACEASFNGKSYGLFSWYWVDALYKAGPKDTWGDIFKRAGAKVTRHFEWQRPQFSGNADLAIFGGPFQKTPPRIPK